MNKAILKRLIIIGSIVFIPLSIIVWLNRDAITFSPFKRIGMIESPTYVAGNGARTVIIENSEKSVLVLDSNEALLCQVKAKNNKKTSFSTAKFVEIDEDNNFYVLDVTFNGMFEDNIERVIKYSDTGKFLEEIYHYQYINEDFIITKGRLIGMAYSNGAIYLLRIENDGFWLEQITVDKNRKPTYKDKKTFFDYPNAFRNLVYFHINPERDRLTVTTKPGGIKQYDFSGDLLYEIKPDGNNLPWTAISDNADNIIYTDIINNEFIQVNTKSGTQAKLLKESSKTPYYRINYKNGTMFAPSDHVLISDIDNDEMEEIDIYAYHGLVLLKRIFWFLLFIMDLIIFLLLIIALLIYISRKKFSVTFNKIALVMFCIIFGATMTSVLIITEMSHKYYEKTYSELENVSRLMTGNIDTNILKTLSIPSDYERMDYISFKDSLKTNFSFLPFKEKGIYQIIWMEREEVVYMMYDLENSVGIFYPFSEYEGSIYQQVTDSKEYIYTSETTSEGSWMLVMGPIFDHAGNVVALVETGYVKNILQEQIRDMVIQIILIVAASIITFLLIMIEFILILNAYNMNKLEMAQKRTEYSPGHLRSVIIFLINTIKNIKKEKTENKTPVIDEHILKLIVYSLYRSYNRNMDAIKKGSSLSFRPELPRALVFFLFVTTNLASAILPMYAVNLYEPLFDLPKELVVTLPITADMIAATFALLLIPYLLEKIGIKRITLIAAGFIIVANVLCFIAQNILYLTIAYALIGFSGGALLLVINTVISAQKDEKDVNSGFAHFNASYLAGVNVGVVLGSILAQFFSYRMVYLFSSFTALLLFCISLFSLHSSSVSYMYEIQYVKDVKGKQFVFLKFIFNPLVLGSLLLLLLPYAVSLSFTSYFMPIYGIEHGLRESNIGQLILLNGLFAILFGTSLCKYVMEKLSVKMVITASLLLNIGSFYLFSFYNSIVMLVITIVILSISNIFFLTNMQTYYVSLYQNADVSSMRALSVYSAVENFSMAIGPVVFSYILARNMDMNMKLFASCLLACLIVFILISMFFKTKKNK